MQKCSQLHYELYPRELLVRVNVKTMFRIRLSYEFWPKPPVLRKHIPGGLSDRISYGKLSDLSGSEKCTIKMNEGTNHEVY